MNKEKRIGVVIPNELLEAADEAVRASQHMTTDGVLLHRIAVDAVLTHLTNHPLLPTNEQLDFLIDSMPALTRTSALIVIETWLRAMFLGDLE